MRFRISCWCVEENSDASEGVGEVCERSEVHRDRMFGSESGESFDVVDERGEPIPFEGFVDAVTAPVEPGVTGKGDDPYFRDIRVEGDEQDAVGELIGHTGPAATDTKT